MLVQFAVENFLSFKAKTTFSMVADGGDRQHPLHVLTDEIGKAPPLLRAAAIYGANAAGKSNLVNAILFAQNLIVQGTESGQTIPVVPFKLGRDAEQPGKFEFIFTYQDVVYFYGFSLNSAQILDEWLYATLNMREVRYFERTTLPNKEVKVEFGPQFTGRSREQTQFLEFVARGTRPNQLFLTEAVDRNVAAVAPVNAWFKEVLLIIPAEATHRHLEFTVHQNTQLTDFLSAFLHAAGTGIEGVVPEEIPLDFDRYFPAMSGMTRSRIVQQLQNTPNSDELLLNYNEKPYCLKRGTQGQPTLVQLKTQHRTEDGQLIDFTIEEESEGTQRLIHLAPALLSMKVKRAGVVILDELDRRMHPLLSRLFVQTALGGNGEDTHNQLIFTTHETSLLDLELLRRDEIWFVEKDLYGASHIYSLAEFKIRPDLKVQKGYLNGRFGAIPFIGDIHDLGWTAAEPPIAMEAQDGTR
jgi:AAA15 family ATPase/GTPase